MSVTLCAVDGPLFVTTIVKLTVSFNAALVTFAVFITLRLTAG